MHFNSMVKGQWLSYQLSSYSENKDLNIILKKSADILWGRMRMLPHSVPRSAGSGKEGRVGGQVVGSSGWHRPEAPGRIAVW